MIQKQSILQIKNVYTANAFSTTSGFYVGAGSETDPDVQLYDLASGLSEVVNDCPGGMMSFIPVPGRADSYLTIMGLFPPFIGREAGLFVHHKSGQTWKTQKAMELPFAHRCEFIQFGGVNYLVAASVSKLKENPADWSRPGEVHLIPMDDPVTLPLKSVVINAGITRNHGMLKTMIDGQETICVSGEQGIFSIQSGQKHAWELKAIFEKEVSEMTFIDLDGDGNMELVTIEPFHGNTLNIYKRLGSDWALEFSDSLSFGHGLSSGFFNGEPVIMVGNRSASLALEMFTTGNLSKGVINRRIIEEGVGPTQTQVFSHKGVDYILSANQKKNEVALYSGSLE